MAKRNPHIIKDFKFDHGYRGNPLLKKPGEQIEWTPEMVEEYLRCKNSAIYFIRHYVKIVHVDHGLVPFDLWDFQEEMLENFQNHSRTVVTTARQVGKSTTTMAFLLWHILFNADKTLGILANKGDIAREILGRVRLAYQHLPKWLQQGVVEWNKGMIELENNSKIIATSTSKDAARGFSFSMLFIDECAHVENWEEFSKSVLPTISSGKTTKLIMVSTPNGMNHFHQIWSLAKKGLNGYKTVQVMWDQVPNRDDEWRKKTLAEMNFDETKFEQEYCCEFQGSSGTLIAGWKLKELEPSMPIGRTEDDNLAVYFAPVEKNVYVISADVSEGKGLDYSAFTVINITKLPYTIAAVFRSNQINVADYASVIFRVAKHFNDAYIMVEINSIGGQVTEILHETNEYENLLYTSTKGRAGRQMSTGFVPKSDKGLRQTKSTKAIGTSMLKVLVEQDKLLINDNHIIEELSTFSKKGTSYEAEKGKYDDLTMALVVFSWMTDQQYFKDLVDHDLMKALREKSDDELIEDLVPVGIFDDGMDNMMDPNEVIDMGSDEFDKFMTS
jgi:hypothetical protein